MSAAVLPSGAEGKREDREVTAGQAMKLRRVMRRYRLANTLPEKRKFLRKSQLWSEDFTAKLFCNVEFWIESLPELISPSEGFIERVANGEDGSQFGRPVALKH